MYFQKTKKKLNYKLKQSFKLKQEQRRVLNKFLHQSHCDDVAFHFWCWPNHCFSIATPALHPSARPAVLCSHPVCPSFFPAFPPCVAVVCFWRKLQKCL